MALLRLKVTRKILATLVLLVGLGLLSACDDGGSTSTVSPPSITPTPVSE
ncbi:MAG: hypothetical protein Q6K80_01255 [Thermostichus sp. DG_1_6_bins_120]